MNLYLEQVIREENNLQSFPVITIGNKERLDEHSYRGRCASRLVEILFDIENYMGVGRLYIPESIAKLLIDRGADVNSKSLFGATPLSRARGNLEITGLLLARGATD